MIKPYVEYTASAVLLNPFGYEFPFDTLGGGATTNKDSTQVLTVKTKLVLAKGRIVMLFKNSHVSCYCDYKDDEEYKVLTSFVEVMMDFIMYRTSINYNIISGCRGTPSEVEKLDEIDGVSFNLLKILRTRHKENKNTYSLGYTENKAIVRIKKNSIDAFLNIANGDLLLAIHYYLKGCQTREYFLFEFYKSAESIKNYFGKEKEMAERLRPHGFVRNSYGRLRQYCNDQRKPVSIGRHAPKRGASLHIVNIKRLFEDPGSEKVFRESALSCRNTIDSFLCHLLA